MAGNIYKYNIWNTYQERGMSNDDIASSLVGEAQRRFYNMSANDKQALGISDDMFSNSRLYNKLEDGQLRAIYDDSSQPGIPSYQIELDLDGDATGLSACRKQDAASLRLKCIRDRTHWAWNAHGSHRCRLYGWSNSPRINKND